MSYPADDKARVIQAALEVCRDIDKAKAWFRHTPLQCFDGRMAEQLVRKGRTDDVLRHVASLDAAGWSG